MTAKTLELKVDLGSLSDINKAINLLKCKRSELEKSQSSDFVSKKEKHRRMFNACFSIIETDISDLYADITMDETPQYYVYAHADESRKIAINKHGISSFAAILGLSYQPFYIGKGSGSRCFELNRNETHRKVRQKLASLGKDVSVVKIKDNLTEKEALILESKLVDIFGVMGKGGTLVNLDEGIRPSERRKRYEHHLSELSQMNRGLKLLYSKEIS